VHDWTLVGRHEELATLEVLLAPTGGSAVLFGPGGVGKTRLADELAHRASERGFAIAHARATRSSAEIPLGAIAPLLPKLGDRTVNLLNAARDALAERAGGRDLLLVVDDAHLLDHMSASLVHHLVVGRAARVVATVRSGEPVSDAVTALWKEGHAERIDVGALPPEAIDELVDEALGSAVSDRTRRELHRVSSGNPLALRELVLGSLGAGTLAKADGVWRLEGALTLSSRLNDLVGERLAGLSDDEREGLELVALGEPVAVGVIERLVDDRTLGALEDRNLLRLAEEDGRLRARLVHPIHGEVARQQLGGVRRRRLLRRLADAVTAGTGPDPHDVVRVALWQLDSGAEADADTLMRATRAAIVATDWVSAERLATAAHDRRPSFAAAHCAGYAASELGHHDAADGLLVQASDMASTDEERVLAALAHSENLFRMDRGADAEALVEAVEALVDDPDWRLELAGHRATFVMLDGRPAEALALTAPARVEGAAVRPFVEAAISAVPCLAWDARPGAAIAMAERAHAAHLGIWEQQLFQSDPGIHIVTRASALLVAGRLAEAEELGRFALEVVREAGDQGGEAWLSMVVANSLHYQGRLRSAADLYRRSVELFGLVQVVGRQRWPLAGVAVCLAQLGDVAGAEAAIALADQPGQASNRFNEAALDDARAWVLVGGGEVPAALDLLDAAADRDIAISNRSSAAIALLSMVRLGRPERAVDRLEAIGADTDSDLLATLARHARAAVDGHAEALDAVATAYEGFGALLWGAEAAAGASKAWHREGHQRHAAAAAKRSDDLAARCDGARTPALLQGVRTNPLTKRELEVARLAAEGLSSREIAARLYLSARTVENHLQRSYEKLGVKGRDELATALGPSA
jgi:DNA-binding CsgD family transcriptional regulator